MATLKPTSVHSREVGDLFAGLTDGQIKETGNFWAWFWLVASWEARKALGLVGEGGSEPECSQHPHPRQGWNPVNKILFPSTLIVGSYVKAPGS